MVEQLLLFDSPLDADSEQEQDWAPDGHILPLDEIFAASQALRRGERFCEMLATMAQFSQFSPLNGLLIALQSQSATMVATAGQWRRQYGRQPKANARPMVILAPAKPVLLLFDINDTEGPAVPQKDVLPRKATALPPHLLDNVHQNGIVHGIAAVDNQKAPMITGAARLNFALRRQLDRKWLAPWMRYLIPDVSQQSPSNAYPLAVLELAHIFCGHLGSDGTDWWPDRPDVGDAVAEMEAAVVRYLVCRRRGLQMDLPNCLSMNNTLPCLTMSAVLKATLYIESMGSAKWKPQQPKGRPR